MSKSKHSRPGQLIRRFRRGDGVEMPNGCIGVIGIEWSIARDKIEY